MRESMFDKLFKGEMGRLGYEYEEDLDVENEDLDLENDTNTINDDEEELSRFKV